MAAKYFLHPLTKGHVTAPNSNYKTHMTHIKNSVTKVVILGKDLM
jgi:hypothetical protein